MTKRDPVGYTLRDDEGNINEHCFTTRKDKAEEWIELVIPGYEIVELYLD